MPSAVYQLTKTHPLRKAWATMPVYSKFIDVVLDGHWWRVYDDGHIESIGADLD